MRTLAAALAALTIATLPAAAHQPRSTSRRIAVLEFRVAQLAAEVTALRTHAGKHAWPDLSAAEKTALAGVLKTLPKGTKIDIVCNDAGCADLAADVDDACESAGVESSLDHSLGPLGYGIGVQVNVFDREAAATAIAALRKSTGGRLDPPLLLAAKGVNPQGYVTVLIGKYRRTGK